MTYHFDIEHAQKYGVDEAIMLNNIIFWLRSNFARGCNIHDGKPWTYNSARSFALLFPFWNEKKIRRILDSLIELRLFHGMTEHIPLLLQELIISIYTV